jgi:flagellum-specific peptidoglycan hydrolase FlgJ
MGNNMPLSAEQHRVLDVVTEAAVNAERTTGCPAELSTAQCLIESAWLTRIPPDSNNVFGIKNTDRYPGCSYCFTKEFIDGTWTTQRLAFETYPTLTACFADHGNLLMGGYGRNVYSPASDKYKLDHDLDAFITGISRFYATDPGYRSMVTTLAHGPNVTAHILKARTALTARLASEAADNAPLPV